MGKAIIRVLIVASIIAAAVAGISTTSRPVPSAANSGSSNLKADSSVKLE